jgi:hypothetical protein
MLQGNYEDDLGETWNKLPWSILKHFTDYLELLINTNTMQNAD